MDGWYKQFVIEFMKYVLSIIMRQTVIPQYQLGTFQDSVAFFILIMGHLGTQVGDASSCCITASNTAGHLPKRLFSTAATLRK